mmetsp:Transcript_24658/g.57461  ORF Transcript_24658/g.57461 Transcript_24658/m.57461 type:complete len:90 (+) Transcript_24658:280-549(+)
MDTTTTTTTSSPDHASSSVAKSFKRPRRVVQFDDKAEEILVPNKPIFEKTEWIGWHTVRPAHWLVEMQWISTSNSLLTSVIVACGEEVV